jgi:hypothetical protein
MILAGDPDPSDDPELKQLLDDAKKAAEAEPDQEAERKPGQSGQRLQSLLNPEISFLGDFSYNWSDQAIRNEFVLRGAELALQAPLDPYTRFKAFLVGHQHATHLEFEPEGAPPAEEDHAHSDEISINVEEAYMEWVGLPWNSRVRLGKFRQQSGTLNRWHIHSLPSTDSPLALRNVFGPEGLVGLGVSLDFQLGSLWASSNSLTIEITNGDNSMVFAGPHFSEPAFLIRHTGFFDLGDWSYFEVGITGLTGANNEEGTRDTRIGSIDFNYLWEPEGKGKHKGLVIRGEFLRTLFEEETGTKVGANSWYTYITWQMARNLYVGMRIEDAELVSDRIVIDPDETFEAGLGLQAITAYVTYWQSEFVRLRLQVQRAERDVALASGPMDDNRAWLQVTFAAGPHKHESY